MSLSHCTESSASMLPHGDPPRGCADAASLSVVTGHSGHATAPSGLQCSSDAADPASTDGAHSNADNEGVTREGE